MEIGTQTTVSTCISRHCINRLHQDCLRGCGADCASVCFTHHSSNVNFEPILRLHRGHKGTRFSIVVGPPFDSGMLCPDSNSNTVIFVEHQVVGHFPSNTLPIFATHTSSRSLTGIFSFRFSVGLDTVFGFPFDCFANGRIDRIENNFRSITSILRRRLKPFKYGM
jgi:hypothetical protein